MSHIFNGKWVRSDTTTYVFYYLIFDYHKGDNYFGIQISKWTGISPPKESITIGFKLHPWDATDKPTKGQNIVSQEEVERSTGLNSSVERKLFRKLFK